MRKPDLTCAEWKAAGGLCTRGSLSPCGICQCDRHYNHRDEPEKTRYTRPNRTEDDAMNENRAYARIEIKSVDDEERVIEGIASTPNTDRMDDIVEPLGAKFQLPMPLLHQHNSRAPIGRVFWAQPNSKGIPFKAKIEKTDVQGEVKNRLDNAWQELKLGLVPAVSIGFKPIKMEPIDEKNPFGGIRFKEWEWLELSAVTIPANIDATITNIRSFDRMARAAATGILTPEFTPEQLETIRRQWAATGHTTKPTRDRVSITIRAQEGNMAKKTVAEQISAFEATRAANQARMDAIMDEAAEKGVTLDEAQKEEHDTLKQQNKEVDDHLVRLRERDQQNRQQLVPVTNSVPAVNGQGAAPWNQPDPQPTERRTVPAIVRAGRPNLAKATHFFRWAQVMMMAKGNKFEAANYCMQNDQWMAETPELVEILRAAVPAGTTSSATWAGNLVNYTVMVSEFIELLYAQTVLGRLQGFRRVPFNIKVPRQTAGTSVNWVGEGAAKPLTKGAFDTVSLTWSKVAGICAFTQELVRFSNPSAEDLIRTDLTKAVAKFLDEQFLDTSKTEVANVSPASVTNGSDSVTATGETAAAFRKDFKHAMANFVLENLDVANVTILMKPLQAMSLGLIVNSTTSVPEFPNIGVNGGSILGIPVLVSNNVPSGKIIFIAPGEILLADDGGVDVSISTEASLQMDDNPTDDAASVISLWQSNMIGLRVERFINWKKRRQEAVVYITGADYGGVGTGT